MTAAADAADGIDPARGIIGAAAEVRQRAVGSRRQRHRHRLGLAGIRVGDRDLANGLTVASSLTA